MLVLGVLGDQSLDLAVLVGLFVGHHDDRHVGMPGLDRRQRAAVSVAHPQLSARRTNGHDRHQHAKVGHAGQELSIELRIPPHVAIDQQRRRLNVNDGGVFFGYSVVSIQGTFLVAHAPGRL